MNAWIEQNLEGGRVTKQQFMGGSGWSSAYVYSMTGGQQYFVKLAVGRDDAMFRGEALGLQAMYGEAEGARGLGRLLRST